MEIIKTPIFCLSGPTASGKSQTAINLAKRWPIEIINVNSATIYRGMDIGTDKPSINEQKDFHHHLIDICDPAQKYSSAEFIKDTNNLISKIVKRGNIPFLVGGTMMYFNVLRNGLNDLPAANEKLRIKIENYANRKGWHSLYEKLQTHDPETAKRLSPNDKQRIQRAIEIYLLTGQTMSKHLINQRRKNLNNSRNYITISLEPSERGFLFSRIEKRFDQMLDLGLLNEVKRFYTRADLHLGIPSMRCIGYRQYWKYLDGSINLDCARSESIISTRKLAKSQITWLRAQPDRIIIDCLEKNFIGKVVDTVSKFIKI
ncbi:MAG: tRNA (adenosine(37)-N6)-dimethylallyltransferase MiaA [Bordetella sp.]|nr:MAG: tRNA (adenosine(37)-N6)-dimethylallyltransferase MiaA [Bordetella sp.]